MYTICYIVFFVLSTAAAFKNDKGNQMHFTDNQHGILCRFYYGSFTHNENAKSSNFNRNYFMVELRFRGGTF